jgi:hypothetical protein
MIKFETLFDEDLSNKCSRIGFSRTLVTNSIRGTAVLSYAQEDLYRPIDRRGRAIQRLGGHEQYANIEDPKMSQRILNDPQVLTS